MAARKTIDISTVIDMANKITTSSEFWSYEREAISAFVECLIEKTGNKVKFQSLTENAEDFQREYQL